MKATQSFYSVNKLGAINFFLLILTFLITTSCDLTDPKKDKPKPEGYQEDIPLPSLADSPWPRYRGNAQNNGKTFLNGPVNGIIFKSLSTERINSGITIGADSSVYFVTSFPGYLYSLNRKGNLNWKIKLTEQEIESTPIVGNDGTIYVGLFQEKKLFSISSEGNIKWSINTTGIVQVSMSVGLDGTLYFIDLTQKLNAVDKNGKLLWQLFEESFGSVGTSNSAMSPDGKVLYVTSSHKLYAVDISSQTFMWKFWDDIGSSVQVDSKGNLYCVAKEANEDPDSYYFYSIYPSGSARWKYKLSGWMRYSDHGAAMDINGNIFFAADTVYSLDYYGKLRWKQKFPDEYFPSSFICDGSGNLYSVSSSITDSRKTIYCFNNNGSVIREIPYYLTEGLIYGSATIGFDNTLYIPVDSNPSEILIIK